MVSENPNAADKPNVPAAKSEGAANKPSVTTATVTKPDIAAQVKPSAPVQYPNEPAFQLKLDPDQFVVFKSDKITEGSVEASLVLTNPTKEIHVYKVKCTSNEIFRVRPPLAYIKPEETMVVKLNLQSKTVPEDNKHFFAFYHMAITDNDTKKLPKQRWTAASKPDGVKRIHVKFQKKDGSPWNVSAVAPASSSAPPAAAPDTPSAQKPPAAAPAAPAVPAAPEKK